MKGKSAIGPSVSVSITVREFGPDREKPTMPSEMSRRLTSSPMWS